MCQINLIKLSIIGRSAINTRTSSCPRSTGGSVSFVCLTFVFIRYLIKINITFSINSLCGGIIHISVDNHLIRTVVLLILFVGNNTSTKRGLNTSAGSAVRSSRLRILILCINTNIHQHRLNRSRISTGIQRRVGFIHMSITILFCGIQRIKRHNPITIATHSGSHINWNLGRRTGIHINIENCLTVHSSKNAIGRNNIIAGDQQLIISTLEPNTSESK